MKQFIFSILLVASVSTTSAQDRLGYSQYQITHEEFPDKKFDSGYTFDKHKWVSWKNSKWQVSYYFSLKDECNFVTIQPVNDAALKDMINKLTANYKAINDSLWENNTVNDDITIKLKRSIKGEEYFSFTSKKYPLKTSTDKPAYILNTDNSSQNDIIKGTYYRNTKYKFRVHFIDNWIIDKGRPFDHITIRSYQKDSGKVINLIIIDYLNTELKDQRISEDTKKSMIDALKNQGITPTNFIIKKGWLNNFPADIFGYEMIKRDGAHEIPYTVRQVNCTTDGKMYCIGISMPSIFYNEGEEHRFFKVLSSFYFEKFPD